MLTRLTCVAAAACCCLSLGCATYDTLERNCPPAMPKKVYCEKPPPDYITLSWGVNVDVVVRDLGQVAKGNVDSKRTIQQIASYSPNANDFRLIQRQTCLDFTNCAINETEYTKIRNELIPLLRGENPTKSQSSPQSSSRAQPIDSACPTSLPLEEYLECNP